MCVFAVCVYGVCMCVCVVCIYLFERERQRQRQRQRERQRENMHKVDWVGTLVGGKEHDQTVAYEKHFK